MPDLEQQNIGRAAGVVGLFTLLSRILGLVRDMVLAAFFGAGMAADAFFAAFRIPNLLRRLFAEGSLTISFIPVFTEYLTTKGKKDAFDLARAVLTLLSLILVLVTLLGILLSPWIVRIQAYGFGSSGPKYELTVLLTRITFPYIFFISLVALFMGILNSLRHFAAPAAAPILLNVGIIGAAYFISDYFTALIVGVAVGVLIGGVLQAALQIPWVLKEGVKLLPCWQPGHRDVKRIGLLLLPAIFGSAVYQLNGYIGALLASFLEEGSVSWLYYADRLVQFPLGIFAIAISTAALPSLSTQAAERDYHHFRKTLAYALGLVFFITLPSMAGLIVLGRPIVRILLERGAFDAVDTSMTYDALFFYTLGLWAFSGVRVIVSAFFALQDTKTPVKAAVLAFLFNLVFSLTLMEPLRHGGLALSLSMSSSLQFFFLVFFLKRKFHLGSLKPIMISSLKCALAAAAMGISVFYIHSTWLPIDSAAGLWSMIINLAELIALGMIIYFIAARIMRCAELAAVWEVVRSIPGTRK